MTYTKKQIQEIADAVEELNDMPGSAPMSETMGLTIFLALMKLQNTLEEIKEHMQKQ